MSSGDIPPWAPPEAGGLPPVVPATAAGGARDGGAGGGSSWLARVPVLASAGAGMGPFWLAVGLVLGGVLAYVYLALAGRALGPQRFTSLGVLWTMINIVGPGLFVPIELEMSRAISHRRGLGEGGLPLFRQAVRVVGVVLAGLAVLVAAASPVLRSRLYDGSWWLVAWTLLATAFIAVIALSRGVFASTGHFTRYGVQFIVEGVVKAVLALAGLLAGLHGADVFGAFLVLALAVSVLTTFTGPRRYLDDGPPAAATELTTRLALLLGTSVLSFSLVNCGPILVKLLAGPGEQRAAGVFLSGLQVARVPLFFFAAVSVVMLPGLSAAYARRDLPAFRAFLRRVLLLVGAIGVADVVGTALFGPWAVTTLFGRSFVIGRADVTLLAVGSALYMVGLALSQALLAVESHAAGLFGWLAGMLGLIVATVVLPGLQIRVAWGFAVGTGLGVARDVVPPASSSAPAPAPSSPASSSAPAPSPSRSGTAGPRRRGRTSPP
jgi:O-antigen/teichoic acid export membrane protein